MEYPIFIVDAFADKLFAGNPAAVCPLETWLPTETMQQLAVENNLSETVFFVPQADGFNIRWFTPGTEVKLCGHATLAAAHVLFTLLNYPSDKIVFYSLSGPLKVTRNQDASITLNFPSNPPEAVTEIPEGLFEGLGIDIAPVFKTSFDYMVVLPNQQSVLDLQPDFSKLAMVKARGVIATAKGLDTDFVSRCFYPQSGVNEDPVTGSAHTIMTPYWAAHFQKTSLSAVQLSARKGYLQVELLGNRVAMTGKALTYLKGHFQIN
ncbi:MAG: isomerase [Bacteroidetes bacterium 24-39-8]|jgi:PhzF family phenazine biosynthesis protein|nr:MAG: isomerase [Sphingobacteriia bacterium 35-40-8]OYZ50780.1 MAG: isomerase [Bacteroidetes bacterium 24-39-8]HQR93780.1 PhzF family phenazine biosynthesis protein [Sediminibacterium sp.]HQS56331.1 PhzF family phenazine biosynthesis protein [Sediminibacterium sp.]